MRERLSKARVRYRQSKSKGRRCGTCVMFRWPIGCTLVKGIIFSGDVCDRWETK